MAHPLLSEENFAARLEVANESKLSRDFNLCFPPLPSKDPAPALSWEEIERQLTFLSGTDRPRWEVNVLRKQSQNMPPEYFLQQLLILAWAVIDDSPDTAAAMRGPSMD